MSWFQENAPIRLKMLIVCGIFWTLIVATAASSLLFGPSQAMIAQGVLLALALGFGLSARSAICTPYVNTVVRMEGLAAGDLTSPIAYTQYEDCVGRMTKAMLTFRDNARAQIELGEQADRIVTALSGNISRLAAGDLTCDITGDYPPLFRNLKDSFNSALISLRELVGSVIGCTEAIRGGSSEIVTASQDLAQRTETNAASLEETSAAIAQIDDRIKSSATAAEDTVRRTEQAMAAVNDGRHTANDAMGAMARVSESAKGIDTVIEGLDKIAFQTRVLAMNAAVEAGRAGDAGRGFAVVADLVSALAMRAEEEAKRARTQLTVTQQDIVGAVGSVESVDEALQKISANVTSVQDRVAEMAESNRQQAHTISEINMAVGAIDKSTQQNAAMVEETSAASATLLDEVRRLAGLTARFDTGEGAGLATELPSRPSALPARRVAGGGKLSLVATDAAASDASWNKF